MNLNDYKFTFETEAEYSEAALTGYIDDFNIVRVNVSYGDGCQVDYPIKSREAFEETLASVPARGGQILAVYQDTHYYDVTEYID